MSTRINKMAAVAKMGAPTPYSLSFDGTNDTVNAGNGASLQFAGSFTISQWAKVSSLTPDFMMLTRKGVEEAGSFWIGVHRDDYIYGGYYHGASSFNVFNTTFTPTVGAWHHVVTIFDQENDFFKIVIDDQVELDTQTVTETRPGQTASDLHIGSRDNTDRYLEGLLDDVRLYDRALSLAEVSTLFGGGDVASGLVSHWKFDEGNGSTALDAAGPNDGSIIGATYSTDTPF